MVNSSPQMPEHVLRDPEALLSALRTFNKPLRTDKILSYLKLQRHHKKALRTMLRDLAHQGHVVLTKNNAWALIDSTRTLVGRYEMCSATTSYVHLSPEHARHGNEYDKVYVHPNNAGDAWHGDTVRVTILPSHARLPRKKHLRDEHGGRLEKHRREEIKGIHARNIDVQGRITHVLEAASKELMVRGVGDSTFKDICLPVDARFRVTIHADKVLLENELARVRLTHQRSHGIWDAAVLATFGCEDSVHVQENLVKLNHEAPADFPTAALDEALALPDHAQDVDMEGREDMRHLPFVTIDGADARDFDDAIYVEERDGSAGGWRLFVGIADVTHYVLPRSALDTEARQRGNSWYFPRSVQPMLPEKLSNGLCSLRPHEDKLVMLAQLDVNAQGDILSTQFSTAVLRSSARLTYDEVRDIIIDKNKNALQTFLQERNNAQELLHMLGAAHDLARTLLACRKARGALDFLMPEPEYTFDAQNRIADIRKKHHHFAHQIIEECMLAANEAVARFLENEDVPFLYRIHPEPDTERVRGLFTTLRTTALAPFIPKNAKAADLQSLLQGARGGDHEFLLSRLTLRTMPQARYSPNNEGHFGLASPCYCHFTSPIRRYADMVVHRALKHALKRTQDRNKGTTGKLPPHSRLTNWGDHLHRCERAALEAEREMARRLATLFLQGREGESFDAIISSVTDFGFFVECAAMPVEGLVPIRFLGDDIFEYDPKRQELTGLMSGQRFALGQSVRVCLMEAHLGRLEITFSLGQGQGQGQGTHSAQNTRRGRQRRPESRPKRQEGRKRTQKVFYKR